MIHTGGFHTGQGTKCIAPAARACLRVVECLQPVCRGFSPLTPPPQGISNRRRSKRQRAGAVQDLSDGPRPTRREASWTAVVLYRFPPPIGLRFDDSELHPGNPLLSKRHDARRTDFTSHPNTRTRDQARDGNCHGSRRGRSWSLLASASPGNSSFTGSHFKGRPSWMAWLARWQTVETRCPMSTGK